MTDNKLTSFNNSINIPIGCKEKQKSFNSQLLKWIGNKQRHAPEIINYFPEKFGTYFEPFLGSGGVLGTLAPRKAVASDCFSPLMEIWHALRNNPEELKRWYTDRYSLCQHHGKKEGYKQILSSYNSDPNGRDFVYLVRACYGGVVRFRKTDGYMSTPCGSHDPILPDSFSVRVDTWAKRVSGVQFLCCDFEESMKQAKAGDLIYCDPPYQDSQSILYGAQAFSIDRLYSQIATCKAKGVFVALSIDGTKYSGEKICSVKPPRELFKREVFITLGRSMLKRFQMDGKSLESHVVADRLLLTY